MTNHIPDNWRDVLGCHDTNSIAFIKACYRILRSEQHPDNGGSAEQFARIQRAWDQAQRELNG